MARCNTCGLYGCRHAPPEVERIHKERDAEMGLYKSYYDIETTFEMKAARGMGKSTYSNVYGNGPSTYGSTSDYGYYDQKKILLKQLHEESMNMQSEKEHIEKEKAKALTAQQSLDKLNKACDEAVEEGTLVAIARLRSLGWEVQINPAVTHDNRKGFQINILPPKETNVQSGKEK